MRTNRVNLRLFFALAPIVLFPALAAAWGGDGHQIVCLIAEERLTPAAQKGVHDLLGKDDIVVYASWADSIRQDRPDTGPWHYVDIDVHNAKFDEKRDGNNGSNVVDAIEYYKKALKDPKTSKDDRIVALKFLVHFVGDMHQPLHTTDRNHDRGGNLRLVFFLDQPRAMNLHSCWDSTILDYHKGQNTSNKDYAEKLNAAVTPEEAAEWVKGTTVDWCNEAHELAIKDVYAGVPVDGPPPKLDKKYVENAGKVIDRQLQRAGVRLASILNDIFQ